MIPKITKNLSPNVLLYKSAFNPNSIQKSWQKIKIPNINIKSPQKQPKRIKLPTNSSQGYGGTQKSCFGQKNGMLKLGRHVDDRYLFPPYQLPEEVVPYVDVLGVESST